MKRTLRYIFTFALLGILFFIPVWLHLYETETALIALFAAIIGELLGKWIQRLFKFFDF